MTQNQENKIFKEGITPVMDKIHKSYPNLSMDMYFTSVISELRKRNVPLSNTLVNNIMDKMARDSMPKGTWDYISGKVSDGNIIKTVFDWTHPSAQDTPFEAEIKRRADLMYKASTTEKVVASVATAGTDVLATAPIAVLCPQSVAYGFIIQGGYDIVNETALLPESTQERDIAAKTAVGSYNALVEKTNPNIVPGWMYSKHGITDLKATDEAKLKVARDWGRKNADWWHDEYDKLGREHKESALVNGKRYTRNECLVKSNQYDNFRGVCQAELTERFLAEQKTKEQQRQEALASVNNENDNENDNKEHPQTEESQKTDFWGQLLNTLGFNGLGNVGKHLGLTLANLPDMLLGVFTGKTKSVGLNADTMIPLASLMLGRYTHNPLLKMALMGYGGLNLINKLGNEAVNKYQGQSDIKTNVQYKRYQDEPLNPRLANIHLEGNTLLADIDHKPCTIALNDTVVKAYHDGALPLNTLANAVLAKNDAIKEQASLAYEQSQQQQQSRGIR